ncbi:hypothetical protein [Streptomyces djakartensis]|uniref:Uncharacterized protein n=1 Tax=Streptomyces djakartensis TaxID=68193 RepID=A0ABQ2ZY36_9ACTN|nr:hypothetical protein [Streptomyces djakartensis]GGY28510.1 hypothetical protein GCM10010384_39650 [Streptomyces djakartensis]
MAERRRSGTRKRVAVAIVASVGIAALAATGVTYASASSSVPQSTPAMQDAAASAPFGGDGQTHFDHNDNGHDNDNGQVHVNERTYSADPGRCTAVISSPATTFNVRNESNRTIEFFNGITCDNGAAVSTVGPHSSSNAIPGTIVLDGTTVPFALVGSFRVLEKHRY